MEGGRVALLGGETCSFRACSGTRAAIGLWPSKSRLDDEKKIIFFLANQSEHS